MSAAYSTVSVCRLSLECLQSLLLAVVPAVLGTTRV
jgi:hypothetical protein